jgi:hypothetical protein
MTLVATYLPWRRIDGPGSTPENTSLRQSFGFVPYFIGDETAEALGRGLFASRPEFLSPGISDHLDPAG